MDLRVRQLYRVGHVLEETVVGDLDLSQHNDVLFAGCNLELELFSDRRVQDLESLKVELEGLLEGVGRVVGGVDE